MDIFDRKDIKPMLIGNEQAPFNSPDFIYELKLDGVRCIMYVDKQTVEIRNKRNMKLNDKLPELCDVGKQIKTKCILDGELYVYKNGKTDFFEMQKRTLLTDRFKIRLQAQSLPVTFTAFDILYYKDKETTQLPLRKRKCLLEKAIKENERINISRFIEQDGIALFDLTTQKDLEGIVAKRKDSKYYEDKRTKDWIKCKNMLDDDFVVTGYILKEKGMVSLILAQYSDEHLHYKGHVTLGVSLSYIQKHTKKRTKAVFRNTENKDAKWIKPYLVGTVKFMEYTANGGLRQPVFKGFREDKLPSECIEQLHPL